MTRWGRVGYVLTLPRAYGMGYRMAWVRDALAQWDGLCTVAILYCSYPEVFLSLIAVLWAYLTLRGNRRR